MIQWDYRPVPIKYYLSDWTLFSVSLPLQVRAERLIDEKLPVTTLMPPADEIGLNSQGFLIRGLSVASEIPVIKQSGDYICYMQSKYDHCYIDLNITFEDYQKKFSSKTRSTINRKVRKYAEHCGGAIVWKTYKLPSEMRDFFQLARTVSKLTYQERLLDAGLPYLEDFIQQAELLASEQRIRAYILFDGDQPVSYLYCPVYDNVLVYAYLGYDPSYMHLSVGTVLQWLALEELFGERRFRYFDFTEGQSDHKRLFATHQRQCANVFMLKNNLKNKVIVYTHRLTDCFSKWLGETLDRFGLKAKIKRFLRFGG
jgi:hypothetical protein